MQNASIPIGSVQLEGGPADVRVEREGLGTSRRVALRIPHSAAGEVGFTSTQARTVAALLVAAGEELDRLPRVSVDMKGGAT